jgi:hypothetical protein
VSPVKYELGFYIPGDSILPIHRRKNLKYYNTKLILSMYEGLAIKTSPVTRKSKYTRKYGVSFQET